MRAIDNMTFVVPLASTQLSSSAWHDPPRDHRPRVRPAVRDRHHRRHHKIATGDRLRSAASSAS
jgi:hypothetical protein